MRESLGGISGMAIGSGGPDPRYGGYSSSGGNFIIIINLVLLDFKLVKLISIFFIKKRLWWFW